jgi:DNA-binding XRE family transcriptional regulator
MVKTVENELQARITAALPDVETTRRVAAEVGCSWTHLTNIRYGRHLPSLALAKKLSRVLDIPLEEFVAVDLRRK